MAEGILLSLTQKLEHSPLPDGSEYLSGDVEEAISNLKMILDFARDANLGEGSRLPYFIGDLAELAQDLLALDEFEQLLWEIDGFLFWLREVKKHVLQLGVNEKAETTEGAREGGKDAAIGLEKDVELLLRQAIFNGVSKFETYQITGMIGIGKTTLAREIYNHADVVDRFDRRAWICASGDLSYKELLMKLIEQVADCDVGGRELLLEEMKSADHRYLQQMLLQCLQEKSYLIVVDDLPENMTLKPIFKGFRAEGKGCRMVATSRSQFIEPTVDSSHDMKTMDSNNSLQLFLKTIFGSEDEFPKKLEKKVREMLILRCGGLPLAIKEVGKQLAEKRRSGIEWEQLLESIDFGSILNSMELVYQNLDPELKSCFLHMAFFKENTAIRADKLEQVWATGGMVLEFNNQNGQIVRLYFQSVIEIENKSTDHETKYCHVNVIMHKLSVKKAEEEIGFEIVSSNGNNRPSEDPHHRVIICSREKYNYFTNQDEHLVSLFFHGGGYFDASPSYWKRLELLRILDWEDFGLKMLPEGIGALMGLRYLGLRNNYIQELPDALEWLKKLEVLDIAQNFMVEVPDIIWKMDSLCQLYMSDIICRKPLKIEALQDVQILTYISADNWTYELSSLQMMTKLSKLGIDEVDGKLDVRKLFASLAELKALEHLILRGFRFRSMPCLDELGVLHNVTKLKLDGLLPMLPIVENFPPNITYLVLVNSFLHEDPMPVLEKLHKLTRLKLRNAYTGRQMVILHQGFPRLKALGVEGLRNLRDLQVGEGAMPNLNYFTIKNCPYLEKLPEEISSMTDLYHLKMVTTRKIARKIHKPTLIYRQVEVEINP